jgi:hypothetical protein
LKGQWLKQSVFALDRWLRWRQGVFEYARTRECVFRVQPAKADRHLRLRDGTDISPGDPILILHLWNENLPTIGDEGPTVAWGRRFGRAMDSSLGQLAWFLRRRPDLNGISAIRIDMALGTAERNEKTVRILSRYGFEPVPDREGEPGGYLRRVGENALILFLVLAANPNAARASLLRRERAVAYLSLAALERRYAAGPRTQ